MERYTYFDSGKFRLKIDDTEYSGDWVDRLAAYEEIGLEPEDMKKAFNEDATLKLAGQILGVTPGRLRELAQAYRLLGNTVYEPNKRGVISTYKIPVKSQNPGFAQKRDTSLQSKYTSRVKALIKTYVEIERKYPK